MKNDMKPSFSPFFFVKASCAFARRACTSDMSHSLKVVRIAAVCCAMTSCAAILRRSGDIFLRVNRSFSDEGAGFSSARSPAAASGADDGSGTASRFCAAANASPLVSRPSLPLPLIFSGSSFSSATTRRTAGDMSIGRFFRGGRDWLSAVAVSLAALGSAAGFAALPEPSSITATTSPIFTSAPSATRVCRTPSFSAVISVETLSVSKVKSASPALTWSPDFLCQTETTPLVIDSPTAGTFTSVLMKALHYAQMRSVNSDQ